MTETVPREVLLKLIEVAAQLACNESEQANISQRLQAFDIAMMHLLKITKWGE